MPPSTPRSAAARRRGGRAQGEPTEKEQALRWFLLGTSLAWLFVAGWNQFTHVDTSYYFRSLYYMSSSTDLAVEHKIAKRVCHGSFSRRFDCRSALKLASQQRLFAVWSTKFLIVFGPPLLLMSANRLLARRMKRAPARRRAPRTSPPRRAALAGK